VTLFSLRFFLFFGLAPSVFFSLVFPFDRGSGWVSWVLVSLTLSLTLAVSSFSAARSRAASARGQFSPLVTPFVRFDFFS